MKTTSLAIALALSLGGATQASAQSVTFNTWVSGQFNHVENTAILSGPMRATPRGAPAPSAVVPQRRPVWRAVPAGRITSVTTGSWNWTRIDSRGAGHRIHAETHGRGNRTEIRAGDR